MTENMWVKICDDMVKGTREILTALLVVLVVLKVEGLIDTSWWWVTAPLTAPLGLTCFFLLVWASASYPWSTGSR